MEAISKTLIVYISDESKLMLFRLLASSALACILFVAAVPAAINLIAGRN